MKHKNTTKLLRASVFGMTLLPTVLVGQDAAVADDEVLWMSPFEVTSESVSGYTSTETLAGTRIKTDLKDLAQSISVINGQFLEDTGATSSEDLLVYTTNTEVGGVYGNYAGTGGGQTYNENGKLVNPSTNNRVRGLDSADNTRDYFLSEAPWDGYNVDRVEMQRGPNSILFGVGSPAGIVNVSSKTAFFDNAREVEIRFDEQGSLRGVVDVNQEIIDDELAVRVIGLDEHTKYQQKPAYEKDKRIFLSARYEPKIFGEGSNTSIRINYENGEIDANRPRSIPPIDRISPWFLSGTVDGVEALDKATVNPLDTYDYYINNSKWTSDYNSTTVYPWFAGGATIGSIGFSNPAQYFDSTGYNPSTPVISRMGGTVATNGGLNADGAEDAIINGIDNFTRSGIAGYNAYAQTAVAGGSYYSDYSIMDSSVFDFYNNLLDGDNKKEWQDWETVTASVSQTFLNNRIGFDLSTFYQDYEEGRMSALDGSSYAISVDFYEYQLDGSENQNVGRAYVGGSGSAGNYQTFVDRISHRATAFVDLRSTDFLEESWVTRVLGHHLISFLASEDTRKTDSRNFKRWAMDTDYTDALGVSADFTAGYRNYDWISYIGGSMLDDSVTSVSGLNLNGVTGILNPGGSTTVRYFDSTWTGAATGATSWGDPYTYYSHNYTNESEWPGTITENTSTQSENPDNYVGWTEGTFNVLSADDGDIEELYTTIAKKENVITSVGVTAQSYMFDDCLVATYGWRKDRVKTVEGSALKNDLGVADSSYSLTEENGVIHHTDGISRTWGLVLHSPDFINKHLPLDMKLSVFYGEGENFKADAPRGDVFGNQIDNPKGNTEDYGFVVSALDGRISLKTTWYETTVQNATLPGTEGTGGLTYWIWAVPNWGATYALAALDGLHDPQWRQGSWGWPWAAMVNYSSDYMTNNVPNDEAREYIFGIVKDFFTNLPIDQQFADQYGMSLDVDAMHAAGLGGVWNDQSTWNAFYEAVPVYGNNPDTGLYDTVSGQGASSLGEIGQTLYGSYGALRDFSSGATATCDTVSKGIEWELSARITDNWNVMLNVSKTEATTTAVSPSITQAIESMTTFLDGDAGNLCLWGSDNLRSIWDAQVLSYYETLMAKIGASASEISPWRANLVTNYNFSEGFLKGVNIGAAYRWEDERILGYQYDAATDALDISKPWYGPSEDHIDLWVGYGCALTEKVDWRIQLNVKNVGEGDHLVPTYIQPDGSVGYARIAYGTSFFITNTFKF